MSAAAAATVSTGDRLSFTVFLALAIHGLLIFGIDFAASKPSASATTLQVTLATHRAKNAPEEADYLAQFNQQASGTEEKKKELTTEREAPLIDSRVNDIAPAPQVQARDRQRQQREQLISTRSDSHFQVSSERNPKPQSEQQAQRGEQQEQPLISPEMASLQAKLDRQKQQYAKRPRKRYLTSVSAKSSKDAEYMARWIQKVERVGNDNYPSEALIRKLVGDLRMVTVINANGTIADVEILQSSGHRLLDEAALQIVHLAAPFTPFPREIRENTDQLEIIRTWHFQITGLTTSN